MVRPYIGQTEEVRGCPAWEVLLNGWFRNWMGSVNMMSGKWSWAIYSGGGSPTATDRVLCTRFGSEAVHLIAQGRTGTMVSLRGTAIEAIEVWKVVAQQKSVPYNGDLVQTARGLGICLGD